MPWQPKATAWILSRQLFPTRSISSHSRPSTAKHLATTILSPLGSVCLGCPRRSSSLWARHAPFAQPNLTTNHINMQDRTPLVLPNLLAACQSSTTSLIMPDDPTLSIYSNTDSGFYSASECSTPPTPSLYPRGHFRFPSSVSSLSSSPPAYDPVDPPNASGKLPKLTEEPIEREYDGDTEHPYRCSCDRGSYQHAPRCRIARVYDPRDEYLTHCDSELRQAKRRRSLEVSAHTFAGKLERRFPSLSRKVRDRSANLGKAARSATPSRLPSTRSSSSAGSIHVSTVDLTDDCASPAPISPPLRTGEPLGSDISIPMPIDVGAANAMERIKVEEIERERCATTPLLPPLLVTDRNNSLPTSSPLQSPTVADVTPSAAQTPMDSPLQRTFPTPPLSSKPSIASFRVGRTGHRASTDIPPMMLSDPNDTWALRLGHANFTILPEPYLPAVCSARTIRELLDDWTQARLNYAKHQVRTAEHYGVTSKHYLLTEQKWGEIDAAWKRNHELAKSHAVAIGQNLEPASPTQPGPFSKLPTLHDPKSAGKFPKLGDEDIVGPMQQAAALLPRAPSRKRAFFKFLSDLRFPGTFLGRSSNGL